MLGDPSAAVAAYEKGKDDEKLAPQAHGNLIRARWLQASLSAVEP
jgi:hypothetical protein